MNRVTYPKLAMLLLAVVLIVTGCGGQAGNSSTTGANGGENAGAPVEGGAANHTEDEEKRVMVIRKIGGDDHTAQYLAGAKREGEALGYKVDTFTANGDAAKFHDAIAQAASSNYDGIIISHGDDEATVDAVQKLRDNDVPVVAFDSNPQLAAINGVTLTSQNDESLAQLALDRLKEEQGDDANIIYLWVDGFPPMVRRNAVFQDMLQQNPGWSELERFGTASGDVSVQTQNAVAALLAKHKEGEIDAIFATWDAFAIGAARALKEAGRTEIKIYGIDVSNADLQIMQEENSPWVATAAVDPMMIGEVNMRLLAKKMAGEDTPAEYSLEATLIDIETLSQATEPVNMVNLADLIPGWGETDAFEEDWMTEKKGN
ncbi:sugar ABC transporter substrate-binding protein [Paenibacillus sp. 1P07SE]|uniref:sugar ABC transporter substrate-binding protein n=1 Tax=Paenibacillus sp. 1P07SE TaxID=3132209 RepID=UPI0039A72A20